MIRWPFHVTYVNKSRGTITYDDSQQPPWHKLIKIALNISRNQATGNNLVKPILNDSGTQLHNGQEGGKSSNH